MGQQQLMSIDIHNILSSDPEIRGGRPVIAGTGITIHRIAIWYRLGYSPEEIANQYGHLTVAQVYAALAYYHSNQAEIEADIARDEVEATRVEAEYAEHLQAA